MTMMMMMMLMMIIFHEPVLKYRKKIWRRKRKKKISEGEWTGQVENRTRKKLLAVAISQSTSGYILTHSR